MKILLIDNNTEHLKDLIDNLWGHSIEVQKYRPGLNFQHQDKDLVILSGGGGEGLEIYDEHQPGQRWYDDEMNFIRGWNKPLIGICMGFEIIANAYDAPITQASGLIQGFYGAQLTSSGKKLFSKGRLWQFESHRWRLQDLPEGFRALATSRNGIEAFEYTQKDKNIIATQFHPEKGGSLSLVEILNRVAPSTQSY